MESDKSGRSLKMPKKPEIRIKLNLKNSWDIEIYNWLKNAPRTAWPVLVRQAIVEYLHSKHKAPPVSLPDDIDKKLDRF